MKKIIFDLDNTLLFLSKDWMDGIQKNLNKYDSNISIEKLFMCILSFEKNMNDVVVTDELLLKYISNSLSIEVTKDELNELLELYANIPLDNIEIVYDTLKYLSKKYELIAYTDWFTENQIKRLKKYNLDQFFTKVYGWDILPLKPSKKGLTAIIGDNDKKDYIFIGDSIEYDIELPNSMGIDTIFYNRKHIEQDKYKEINSIEELKNIL